MGLYEESVYGFYFIACGVLFIPHCPVSEKQTQLGTEVHCLIRYVS